MVVGEQRVRELREEPLQLRVLLWRPVLKEFGEAVAPRDGQPVEGDLARSGRRQPAILLIPAERLSV
jgi:hypothetical protein